MEQLTHEQFVRILRSALHYLYDPVQLRSSPLVGLLNLADEFDTQKAKKEWYISKSNSVKGWNGGLRAVIQSHFKNFDQK